MQPLATVLLKCNKLGSTVTRTNVTPAEAFVLIADFRDLAGGNPILSLEEIPVDREDQMLAPLRKRLETLKETYLRDQSDTTLIEETRNARLQSTSAAIIRVEKNIKEWEGVKALRSLGAAAEKGRLKLRYQPRLVDHLFPGRFPSVPQSFKDAELVGLQAGLMDNLTGGKESFFHSAQVSV